MGIRLALTPEGAEECRKFAHQMRIVNQQITEATDKLKSSYYAVSQDLGIHEPAFNSILNIVTKALLDSAEALNELPPKLEETATKIDRYVTTHRTVENTSKKK